MTTPTPLFKTESKFAPDMEGHEAIEQIRKQPYYAELLAVYVLNKTSSPEDSLEISDIDLRTLYELDIVKGEYDDKGKLSEITDKPSARGEVLLASTAIGKKDLEAGRLTLVSPDND